MPYNVFGDIEKKPRKGNGKKKEKKKPSMQLPIYKGQPTKPRKKLTKSKGRKK